MFLQGIKKILKFSVRTENNVLLKMSKQVISYVFNFLAKIEKKYSYN